jgi:hypothetical protein
MPEHPEVEVLPEWPARRMAVLATVDHGLVDDPRLIGTA